MAHNCHREDADAFVAAVANDNDSNAGSADSGGDDDGSDSDDQDGSADPISALLRAALRWESAIPFASMPQTVVAGGLQHALSVGLSGHAHAYRAGRPIVPSGRRIYVPSWSFSGTRGAIPLRSGNGHFAWHGRDRSRPFIRRALGTVGGVHRPSPPGDRDSSRDDHDQDDSSESSDSDGSESASDHSSDSSRSDEDEDDDVEGNGASGRVINLFDSRRAFDDAVTQSLDETDHSRHPSVGSRSSALPVHPYCAAAHKQTSCVVCLEDFSEGDNVCSLPCGHVYHAPCIDRWLVEHDACPCCRAPVAPQGSRALVFAPSIVYPMDPAPMPAWMSDLIQQQRCNPGPAAQ